MDEQQNIQPMQSDFEQIKKTAENGMNYWSARELSTAMGYSTWQKFNRVLNKALQVAQNRGMEMDEHFIKELAVIRKIGITAADGKNYDTMLYNLDAIIAVGYRVNSYQATQFRIWATAPNMKNSVWNKTVNICRTSIRRSGNGAKKDCLMIKKDMASS